MAATALPGEGPCHGGWKGKYFESCSCDAVCPCTWSALTARATLDQCRALLAYHVESGEIDGVDVSGLSFALFLDTPPVMVSLAGSGPACRARDDELTRFQTTSSR
jgi:hypothetical protein